MKRFLIAAVLVLVGLAAYAGDWIVLDDVDPITDARTVTFVYMEDQFGPFLALRFSSDGSDAYVFWRKYFTKDNAKVIVRADQLNPVELPVSLSTTGTATFFYFPVLILAMMENAQQIVFRATPYRESPITLIVPCEGFREAFAPYRDMYGIKAE